jgi:hypothetical protein
LFLSWGLNGEKTIREKAQKKSVDADPQNADPNQQQENPAEVEYSVSGGLTSRLNNLNIAVAITSYQSGLLYFVGRNKDGGINVHH